MLSREILGRYRRVTIMGLGLFGGGAGAARFFAGLGATVTVTDTAPAEKLARSVDSLAGLGIRYVLGGHRREDFVDAEVVVANQAVRPGNPFLELARARGVPILTETGLALALNPAPWVGVTGSAGKSTTTSLLAAILAEHNPDTLLGGNIGGDLVTRIEKQPSDAPVVVELSSYQLTHIRDGLADGSIAPPRVAVFTNLTPNHLDWHDGMEEYVSVKQSLAAYQDPAAWAVCNYDDPLLRDWRLPARTVWTGCRDCRRDNAAWLDGDAVRLRLLGEEEVSFSLSDFQLLGRHNRINAVQAIAAAWLMCRDRNAVRKGLDAFPGLPHRLQPVRQVDGRVFVNDSKSTTPEAAMTALAAVDRPKVLIAGGYDKKSPFEALGRVIQESATGLVLVGASAERLREAVLAEAAHRPEAMGELPIAVAGGDFRGAVRTAWRLAPEGGVVLLSPACASWGMFVNYEERGAVFASIAAELGDSC